MLMLVIFAHAMLAAIFPIGRAVAHDVQPIFFTGVRMLASGILLLSYYYYRNKRFFNSVPSRRSIVLFALFSLFAMFLTSASEFWALQFVPSGKASFIYSIAPFYAALFSYFFFKEVFTFKKVVGMLIALAGFSLVIVYDAPAEKHMGGVGLISWGEMALLFAAASSAYGWIKGRKLIRNYQYDPVFVSGIGMFFCGILSLLVSLFLESWQPVPVYTFTYSLLGYLILSIICSNLIGYVLIAILTKQYTTTLIALIGFTEPFLAALYGWLLLGEIVSWPFFAAAGIVSIGLYMFYREELRQGYVVKPIKSG